MKISIIMAISLSAGIVSWFNLFTETEIRHVGKYHSIAVEGPIEVFLVKDLGEDIRVVADKGLHKIISTQVDQGRLIIKPTNDIRHERVLKIYASSQGIREIFTTGSSTLDVVDKLVADSLNINMSGSAESRVLAESKYIKVQMHDAANIFMAGKTEYLDMTLTGFSDIVAYKLDSRVCSIKINAPEQSPGIFRVSATDTLTVNMVDPCSRVVYYRGNPAVMTDAKHRQQVIQK